MAVVLVNSNLITNIVASPPVLNPSFLENGRVRSQAATVTVTNGDSIASIYRLCRVMPHWRMRSIRKFSAAITSGAASLGLYRTTADGGAVILAAAYASAQSIASADATGTEWLFSARTVDKLTQQIWQDAGLTSDPKYAMDLCLTLTAAATATGAFALDLEFVVE